MLYACFTHVNTRFGLNLKNPENCELLIFQRNRGGHMGANIKTALIALAVVAVVFRVDQLRRLVTDQF